jgi:hypothetical protein
MRKVVILSFLASLLLGACGEDDYVYPNVLTDMIDLKTDHTGTGRYLITDEGTEWRIQSRTGLDGLAPDTTYRTVTMYAPLTDSEEAEKEAILYNTQLVISPVPLPESKFKEIKTDPVAIQSIWRGGNYLNLILQVKVKDQKHGSQPIGGTGLDQGHGRGVLRGRFLRLGQRRGRVSLSRFLRRQLTTLLPTS